MRFSPILTSEQARLLFDLVSEHRETIIERSSFGILDGLLVSLMRIDRGGGALLGNAPMVLNYRGAVEAALVPRATYIAWPGVQTIPRPYWDLTEMVLKNDDPSGSWGRRRCWDIADRQPVTVYRATDPLLITPLPAAVVPSLPLR